MPIRLSPDATQLLLDSITSRNSKWGATFLLFERSGDPRKKGPSLLNDWALTTAAALKEDLLIYNARSHKVSVLVPAQTRRVLNKNPAAFSLHPIEVELHGPTLHRAAFDPGREIIWSGTYTWEDR